LATRFLHSVIITYDSLQAACCVLDIVDCLLPGLKSSMFSPPIITCDDTVVTCNRIFGLLLRNLE